MRELLKVGDEFSSVDDLLVRVVAERRALSMPWVYCAVQAKLPYWTWWRLERGDASAVYHAEALEKVCGVSPEVIQELSANDDDDVQLARRDRLLEVFDRSSKAMGVLHHQSVRFENALDRVLELDRLNTAEGGKSC